MTQTNAEVNDCENTLAYFDAELVKAVIKFYSKGTWAEN